MSSGLHGGVMVCGTSSDAGKSHVVAGICRMLARRGVSVAPFKAQNMALNSYVTPSGHEIGRAQAAQAFVARVAPEVTMNPILLKPTGDRASQVVVLGRPVGHLTAAEYHDHKPQLLATVLDALADLRRRFDVVVVEGAGSPAEINLLSHDIVNLRIADEAGLPAIVVGDIDRGGVFAALFGTWALLPEHYQRLIRGFVINKFRGDPGLLGDGLDQLEARCGVRTIGVIPFVRDVAIDAEDSLALDGRRPSSELPARGDGLDVAVIRFPRLSNFTDLDAIGLEPGVCLRLIESPAALGQPDLVILPGTKATVADLEWLRAVHLDAAIDGARRKGATILGVCGGYQMLGARIDDDIESGAGQVAGLGWLDTSTTFFPTKVTRQRHGQCYDAPVTGYEIHHGRSTLGPAVSAWLTLDGQPEGATTHDGSVLGTALHGLFDADEFRAEFLRRAGARTGKHFVPAGVDFSAARNAQYDRLADLMEAHIGAETLERIIADGVAP